MARGRRFVESGDFSSARPVYRRAAEAGYAEAALALGETYDPVALQRHGVIGMSPDVEQARHWYERARELGSLEAPTRQIAANSGADGGVVVDRMRAGTGAYGYDAARGAYVDLLEAGIIDPTKVVRVALENAVSVAAVLLLTEATLTEVPEPKPAPAVPAGLE